MKRTLIKLYIFSFISIAIMVVIFCFSSQNGADSSKLSTKIFDKMKDNGTIAIAPQITLVQTDEENNSAQKSDEKDSKKAVVLKERKWAHVYLYALLGIFTSLTALELNKLKRINRPLYASALSVGVCLLYSCSDEFHQHFVEGRTASVYDILFDSIGFATAIAVVFACWGISILLHRRKK